MITNVPNHIHVFESGKDDPFQRHVCICLYIGSDPTNPMSGELRTGENDDLAVIYIYILYQSLIFEYKYVYKKTTPCMLDETRNGMGGVTVL